MKTAKTFVTALVLLFLIASLAFLTFQATGRPDPVRISGFPDWTRSLDRGIYIRSAANRMIQAVQDHPWLRETASRWFHPGPLEPLALDPENFKLTFPHTANGSGGGLSIRSSVIVINNSGANAKGKAVFRKQNGSSWSVNTHLGSGGQFSFELLPGEVLRLETDGSGATQTGWVEVLSDVQLAGSGTFTVTTTGGEFLSEVGIGDSPRGRDLMIFVDLSEGKDAGFGICNPNASSTANLTYELRNLNGTLKATETDSLDPLKQKAEFVTQTFADQDLTNFKGVLRILSTGSDVSLITLRTRGVNFTSLKPVQPPVGDDEQTQFFSRIGDGIFGPFGFRSSFLVMNNSDLQVNASLDIFKDDGSELSLRIGSQTASSFSLQVPARGAVELISAGATNPGVVGWARLVSDTPLGGSGTFTITEGSQFISEVGVPASDVTAQSTIFVQEKGPVSTGIGLTNPNDFEVSVIARLFSEDDGAAPSGIGLAAAMPPVFAGETMISLPPLNHTGLFASQLFPELPEIAGRDFTGRLQLEIYYAGLEGRVAMPVAGLTLLARGVKLTSLPLPEFVVNFGPRSTIAPATLLNGAEPSFCISTRQLAGELPYARAVITLDKGHMDFTGWQEGQRLGRIATKLLYSFLLPGNLWVAETASTAARFFGNITFDSVSEWDPFDGVVRNLPGGGVEFEINSNSASNEPLSLLAEADICFDAAFLQLPAESRILVREEYESRNLESGAADVLTSTRFTELQLEGPQAQSPQIHGIQPLRLTGGEELIVAGSGFASTTGGNLVTVEGNSRVQATVLEASPTQLRVHLPDGAIRGPLLVRVGSKTSNPYQVDVAFAPLPEITPGSSAKGATTTLKIETIQRAGQLAVAEMSLDSTAGEWLAGSLAPGQKIGILQMANTLLELWVESAGGGNVLIHAVEEAGDSPDFEIEISTSTKPAFTLRSTSTGQPAQEMLFDTPLTVSFTEPVFKLPTSNFSFQSVVHSVPERFRPDTIHSVTVSRAISVK